MAADILLKCSLFKSLTKDQIDSMLDTIDYQIISYGKDQIISTEGDLCNRIGIVLDGLSKFESSIQWVSQSP